MLFSTAAAPFLHPQQLHKGSNFSPSSLTLVIFWFCSFGLCSSHPNGCEVVLTKLLNIKFEKGELLGNA